MHDWFLDYRIPVYDGLSKQNDIDLIAVLDESRIPKRVFNKMLALEKCKVINYTKSRRVIIKGKNDTSDLANKKYGFTISFGLLKILSKERPDVVIAEGFFRWAIYAWLYCLLTNTKYVMLYERTFHTERETPRSLIVLRRIMLRSINCVNVNGLLTKEYLKEGLNYRGPIVKGHMVANVNDIAKATEDYMDKNDEAINFLFIGQLVERKGVKELIHFWRKFYLEEGGYRQKMRLHILGEGPLLKNLQSECEALDNVVFYGKVDHDELPKYWRKADIMVMPTREDNWSMVVPESMAAGLPVITTKFNGCHLDLITPHTGWLADFDDYEATRMLFKNIMTDNNLKMKGSNARKLILENFSPKTAVQSIIDAIENA